MKAVVCDVPTSADQISIALDLGILRFVEGAPLVDSRGLLGSSSGRSLLVSAMARHVAEFGAGVVVGGVANSGSVLGVLLADQLGLDFVNVLVDGPRARGLHRQLEPEHDFAGRSIVLVDNWISSGTSILEAARLVATRQGHVAGVLSISASPKFLIERFPLPVHVGIPLVCLTK